MVWWRRTTAPLCCVCADGRITSARFINVYNERTLAVLAGNGARNVCLPPEMPASPSARWRAKRPGSAFSLEVQVFGRIGLALSARCYHARAHGPHQR